MSEKSKPLAATSVATRTSFLPSFVVNAPVPLKVVFCCCLLLLIGACVLVSFWAYNRAVNNDRSNASVNAQASSKSALPGDNDWVLTPAPQAAPPSDIFDRNDVGPPSATPTAAPTLAPTVSPTTLAPSVSVLHSVSPSLSYLPTVTAAPTKSKKKMKKASPFNDEEWWLAPADFAGPTPKTPKMNGTSSSSSDGMATTTLPATRRRRQRRRLQQRP